MARPRGIWWDNPGGFSWFLAFCALIAIMSAIKLIRPPSYLVLDVAVVVLFATAAIGLWTGHRRAQVVCLVAMLALLAQATVQGLNTSAWTRLALVAWWMPFLVAWLWLTRARHLGTDAT